MRYLVVSDLHSNREALDAVLADAAGQYEQAVCCGDISGYGPDPNYVADWARRNLAAAIRGNHDRACAGMANLETFNPAAQAASRWTMGQLTEANRAYVGSLPPGPLAVNGFVLVHGSPLGEDEYVTSVAEAERIFPGVDASVIFFGHTHIQGIFVRIGGRTGRVHGPKAGQRDVYLQLDADAAHLINPGSVGQPRDLDPRAAYALYDAGTGEILLRRVAYDFSQTRRKIEAAGLPPRLGSRLETGR